MAEAVSVSWHDDDALITCSVYPYATGEAGIVLTVYDVDFDRAKTWVSGGPLHGAEEVTAGNPAPEHIKWVWRVAHCELSHPEYFRRRRPKP